MEKLQKDLEVDEAITAEAEKAFFTLNQGQSFGKIGSYKMLSMLLKPSSGTLACSGIFHQLLYCRPHL